MKSGKLSKLMDRELHIKHLFDLNDRASEKASPNLWIRSYLIGYLESVAILLREMQKTTKFTPAAERQICAMASMMSMSPRTMRMNLMLYHHDLSKVPDIEKYVVFDSMRTYAFSIGCRLAGYVMNSIFLSAVGRNPGSPSADLIYVKHVEIQQSWIRDYPVEKILEDTRFLDSEEADAFLLAAKLIGSKDISETSQALRMGTFVKGGRLGICLADEENVDGVLNPFLVSLSLAPPRMWKLTPEDEVEREQFSKVIKKSPGYGMDFPELLRAVAKDYGVYFVPSFDVRESFTRDEGRRRGIIKDLEDTFWQ
jgi:hypothetical protein